MSSPEAAGRRGDVVRFTRHLPGLARAGQAGPLTEHIGQGT